MKIKTLEEQYIFSYNILKVAMPLFSLVWIVSGSVLAIFLKEVFWVGLILIGVGGLIILEFIFIRKFLLNKINQLKENQNELRGR
ncbi:MAG: hypothetical protein HFG90_07770 [Acholeplasmatales bacterium]|nr:hypothetical protein [Acholeplasmatales bacterium]